MKEESKARFGDDRVYAEKYISKARHMEIQVICDTQGNLLQFFERECSVRFRNRPLVADTPSTVIKTRQRNALVDNAIALVKSVDYSSVGTVEFVVDEEEPTQPHYFTKLTTRLQPEFLLSEAITGVDIVKEMINIANGEPLSVQQNDIPFVSYFFFTKCKM